MKYLIPYALIGIAYLPWIPIMLQHLKYGKLWMGPLTVFSFVKSIDFITNNSLVFSIPIFVILLMGLIKFFKNKNRIENIEKNVQIYSIISILVPFIIFFVLSHISTPSFTYRHYIIVLPILIMYISNVVCTFKNKILVQIAFSILVISSLISTIYNNGYYYPHKTDYRGVSDYICDSQNYPVTIEGFKYIKQCPYIYDYYLRTKSKPRPMYSFDGDVSNVNLIINKIKKDYDCFWYIVDDYYNYKDLQKVLFSYTNIIEKKRFLKLTLYKLKIN